MDTKIIFFDIDGTILSTRTNEISDSTREAIREVRANGHLAFVNTGRTFAEIDEYTKSVGFDGFVCGCGTYIAYHGTKLLHAELPQDMCQRIIRDVRKNNIEAVLEGTKAIYFDSSSTHKGLINLREGFIHKYHFNVQNWEAKELSFDKFCLWYDHPDKIKPFLREYNDTFDFILRETSFNEVIPKGYSKATGIEFLLSYLNIPHENTYALGDGANDLPMLRYVKYSIGMGNSDGGVPEIVSFLTKDVDQGGVAYALKHFNII